MDSWKSIKMKYIKEVTYFYKTRNNFLSFPYLKKKNK